MDVRTQVTDFNWEIGLFLRSLARFRDNVNKADSNTIQLLSDTLESIAELINGHDGIVEKGESSKMFAVDENKFEIDRFITCRICCLQIPLSRDDYLNHVTSDYHNAKLIRQAKLSDQNPLASLSTQNSATDARTANGKSNKVNNNAATSSNAARGASWRDREKSLPQAPIAPMPMTTNGAIQRLPQYQGPFYGDFLRNTAVQPPVDVIRNYGVHNFVNHKVGPPLFSMPAGRQGAFPIGPLIMPQNNALQQPPIPHSRPMPSAPSPLPTNQTKSLPAASVPTRESPQPNQLASQNLAKLNPMPKAAVTPPLSTGQPETVPVAPKISPILPPNVFDEDIFDFIESQENAKRTESVPVVNKPVVKPIEKPVECPVQKSKKIVNASTSAEIKPSKPYELNSMYSKFSHLKQPNAPAAVPISTKPVAAKPTPLNSSQNKTTNADDLQIHKYLSKVAQKPNQHHSAKASNEKKSQSTNAQKHKATNEARPALSAGLSGKLKQMFDEINKLHSKAELEQIQASRSLQRTSSIVSLPAAESKTQMNDSNSFRRNRNAAPAHSQTNMRGRSLSNSNITDTSKGAIPKQRSSPNTNNNQYCPIKQCEALTHFFNRDLNPYLSHLMKNAENLRELPLNKTITEEIEQLLLPKYPTVKCHLIGSRMYGIGKESSPIDIYLDLHATYHQDKTAKVYVDGICTAEELFTKSSIWSDVRCSEQTRYGILSVTHNATKIRCRMVFGTGVPVRNTLVVQCLFDVQPVCRQLVICIQLAMQDVQNPSLQRFKNGYAATQLVLFFFQKQKKLPSVKSLQEGCNARIKCGENAVEFQKPKNTPICSDRFLHILVSFFKFYTEFNFGENIISVFEGQEITQSIRSTDDNKLAPSLLRFKRFVQAEPYKWPSHGMCVQDIFMHKRNVTLSVTGTEIIAFRNFCKDALDVLQALGPEIRY